MEGLHNGISRQDLEKLRNSTIDQRLILIDAKLDYLIHENLLRKQRKLPLVPSPLKKISSVISEVGLAALTKLVTALIILIYLLKGGAAEKLLALFGLL
jgi:hypothetical protein